MNSHAYNRDFIDSIFARTAALAIMGVVAAASLFNSTVQAQLIVDPNIANYSSYFYNVTNLVNGADLTAGPSGILGAADTTAGNNAANMWYSIRSSLLRTIPRLLLSI